MKSAKAVAKEIKEIKETMARLLPDKAVMPKTKDTAVTHKLCLIEPPIAENWLQFNHPNNRNMSQSRYTEVGHTIVNGLFRSENGETVKWSEDGWLVDGQNRLKAVIETGIPTWMLVAFNVDSGALKTLDSGKPRSPADSLKISGHVHNLALLAAAASLLDRYNAGNIAIRTTKKLDRDALDVVASTPNLGVSVAYASGKRNQFPVPGSVIAFVHYKFGMIDPEARDRFFNSLSSGADLTAGDPILVCREVLHRYSHGSARGKGVSVNTSWQIAILFKAWNAFTKGQKVTRLTFDIGGSDHFPTIE